MDAMNVQAAFGIAAALLLLAVLVGLGAYAVNVLSRAEKEAKQPRVAARPAPDQVQHACHAANFPVPAPASSHSIIV